MLRAVADELDALRVVAYRVQHAAQRRAREGEQRCGADKAVHRDQVIQLDLRPEADARDRLADDAVAADAAFATEELGDHQRHRPHELAKAERDHREGRAGLARGHVAEQRGEKQTRQATGQRHQADRQRQRAGANRIERVDGQKCTEPAVHRMAEAQHAALAEQHVVGEAGDDGDADLRQHRLAQSTAPQHRRHHQRQREQAPDQPAADVVRLPVIDLLHYQPSRVPSSPLGRKIRINTSSR